MTTYEEVADKVGLVGLIRERYVFYMRIRWLSKEGQQWADGCAQEWAERFRDGNEYACSDIQGQTLLKYMDGLIHA